MVSGANMLSKKMYPRNYIRFQNYKEVFLFSKKWYWVTHKVFFLVEM